MNKRTWGKSRLKYCPKRKKVWEVKYNYNTTKRTLIVYNDMPSYGLEREEAPDQYEERGG
tara:strand:+ start:7702 stop:7881 length:180 start_codon:yes stop_codon:yes gene_type:complete